MICNAVRAPRLAVRLEIIAAYSSKEAIGEC